MSGHNKWKQIKYKKAVTDGKRSKLFGMLGKQITVASRLTSGDINSPTLRAAIENARKVSMPMENIDRAVKKGIGGEAGALSAVTFEAYGPSGVALIIEAITDNNNRTSQELRHLIEENGGNLAAPGAASWAFTKARNENGEFEWTPQNTLALSETDGEKLTALLEALEDHGDVREVFTNAID
jgi:YebC/PmpR family DNA-binding regulatory protein